ncbi:hypothetical protein ACJIZ3_012141 [Penstemon smallii]|uniref:Aluminum-activated malate transporter n=1 Tax=Penstemon smallii TaxID=265156 RepID=A0ABD3UL50_9LAMI
MEMAPQIQGNANVFKRAWSSIKGLAEKIVCKLVIGALKNAKKLGKEDPRRIVHSLKVGLAITLVSLFYYFDFLYEGFGVSAMWAVMTVVVVFEFSVGATLGRGVNRGIATLLGGALGVASHRLASFAGDKAECIILGLSVFLIASMATFVRFFPKLKARYDYGMLIFILTFCLITVSGYREDEVLEMAHKRLSTILIGGSVTVFICIFICPNWAGEDIHKLIAANIEKLGSFLEVSLIEFLYLFQVNFAKWEPRHGKFRYRQPWDLYLKIGSLTRECAYRIDALNGYLSSEMQTPVEIREKIQESCTKMSSECSYALKELSIGVKTMNCSLSADPHILNAKTASKKLKSSLKSGLWPNTDVIDIIPAATVASLLIEIVSCTIKIADSVHELASLSKFKSPDANVLPKEKDQEKMTRTPSIEASHRATFGRGINRGIATLVGGASAVAAHRLATSIATYIRLSPKLKARYDYGMLIFILTFCLITVSGYREDEVIEMAHKRLSTILIGGSVTFFICVFICPNWAGEDFHELIALNIEKLGIFLEGFGHEYFQTTKEKNQENKASLNGYKSVLTSELIEETLVNFAKWEPRHVEIRAKIQELCTKMSSECSYALKELSLGIKTMRCTLSADPHILKAKTAAKKLKSSLNIGLWPETDLIDIIPVATVASLLIEIVSCTANIADSVHELASLSKFKTPDANVSPEEKISRTSSEELHIRISVE